MEKGYKFKTPKEVIEELLTLPFGNSVDFTFDTPKDAEDKNFEPSFWYGIKRICLFGEPEGVLCFGMFGGMGTKIKNIFNEEEIEDIFYEFLNDEANRNVDILCISNEYNGN